MREQFLLNEAKDPSGETKVWGTDEPTRVFFPKDGTKIYKPSVEKSCSDISSGKKQSPVEQPPVEQPPVEQPPVEQPPVEQLPVEQPPVEQPPVEQPPVEQPPAGRGL